ncbi:MAG: PEP-CTERM sorting domain-containing protein [Cyanobacteriota bacterium]|nr:PEP-CTERM sorting domain-containing protein [Cyanobacteriota bacterium]
MNFLNSAKLAVVGTVGLSAIGFLGIAKPATAQACINTTSSLPPVDCAYAAQQHLTFGPNIDFNNPLHSRFRNIIFMDPEPVNIGDMQTKMFDSSVDLTASINGQEITLKNLLAKVTTKIALTDILDLSNGKTKKTFVNEMLQLDILDGLPGGALFRESPTLASTGTTMIEELNNGKFLIDSWFNISAELSLDGGQTWIPSDAPGTVHAVGVPEPSTALATLFVGLGTMFGLRKKGIFKKK